MTTLALQVATLTDTQILALRARLGVGAAPPPDTVAVTVPASTALTSAPQGFGREYPVVTKLEDNPIFELADQTAVTLLWPWLVDMRQDGGDGIALFWSTDHATHANSGIWLATAPGPVGPWTQHGMVFRDDSAGEQCETPAVIWDEKAGRWLLYYQMQKDGDVDIASVAGQITLVATAPTILDAEGAPETWTKIGIALDVPSTASQGQSHTGYFTPFRYDGAWYGFSLFGGSEASRRALWFSEDGVEWFLDPRPLPQFAPLLNMLPGWDETWILQANNGAVIERNGRLWLLSFAAGPVSGGGEAATRLIASPIADDLKQFGRPYDITPASQPWEGVVEDIRFGNSLTWEGAHYVAYRGGGKSGGFGLMEVF